MSEFVISNEKNWENSLLREISKENIARVSENMWAIRDNLSVKQFQKLIELGADLDVVYMDVTRKNAIGSRQYLWLLQMRQYRLWNI